MAEKKTQRSAPDRKKDAARPEGVTDSRIARMMLVGVGVLVVLTIYNTVAIHVLAPGSSEGTVAEQPASEESIEPASTEALPEAVEEPSPEAVAAEDEVDTAETPDAPRALAGDERELRRLLVRAEQEMRESDRVYGYLYFANAFRRAHADELAAEARARAEKSLGTDPVRSDLLELGDSLRDSGDADRARESYYLYLCRSARLTRTRSAATYFRVADLAFRDAMAAPRAIEGGQP